jgi:hypothetical protein
MTDLPTNSRPARPVGELLPAISTSISETASSESLTTGFSAPALRLSDEQLAGAMAIATMPLPPLATADAQFLDRCLRMLTTLPRRRDDEVTGKLRVRAYELAIGAYPRPALEFLIAEALRTCRFFPSTSECVDILGRWERNDEALRSRRSAELAVRREQQARFDQAMRRLSAEACDQAEIDALPERWKRMAETYGFLWREDDGSYVPRSARSRQLPASVQRAESSCGIGSGDQR